MAKSKRAKSSGASHNRFWKGYYKAHEMDEAVGKPTATERGVLFDFIMREADKRPQLEDSDLKELIIDPEGDRLSLTGNALWNSLTEGEKRLEMYRRVGLTRASHVHAAEMSWLLRGLKDRSRASNQARDNIRYWLFHGKLEE